MRICLPVVLMFANLAIRLLLPSPVLATDVPAQTTPPRLVGAARPAAAPEWVTPPVKAPRVRHETFDSAAAKTKVSYHIYTPAEYDAAKDKRYPVMYWLHGTGGGSSGVPTLAGRFDAAIRAGQIPPMLIVFPNGLTMSMWCDSKDGKAPVETIVIKELIPHIDSTYRTDPRRESRLVEGFSMGGYGAARLGFKHHKLFGTVSILAGGPLQQEFKVDEAPRGAVAAQLLLDTVFGGDQKVFQAQSPWVLAEQHADALRSHTRVRQLIGDRDATLRNNRKFDTQLTRLKIPHAFIELPGVDHNPKALLDALGEKNWEFYRAAFGTRPEPHPRMIRKGPAPSSTHLAIPALRNYGTASFFAPRLAFLMLTPRRAPEFAVPIQSWFQTTARPAWPRKPGHPAA